jgi:glycosyltransferase involved in cell wall biosynthesis
MGLQPLVSVCIPCYNGGDFIGRTLESVLNQTLADLEVIVSDDHSTDATISVLAGFADRRIKLVQNDHNLGITRNWQQALSLASGKYLKLLCGDDLVYPDCLARQVAALEAPANAGASLAICNSHIINARDEVILNRPARFRPGLVRGADVIRKCVRWGTNLVGEPMVGLFRRSALDQASVLESQNPFLIDMELWAGILKQGDAFVDAARLAAFRISGTSLSAEIGLKQAACFRRFARSIRNDAFYETTRFDLFLGGLLSFQWCFLRNAFVWFHSRRSGRSSTPTTPSRNEGARRRAPADPDVRPKDQERAAASPLNPHPATPT